MLVEYEFAIGGINECRLKKSYCEGLLFFLYFLRRLVIFETIWITVQDFLPPPLKEGASFLNGGHASPHIIRLKGGLASPCCGNGCPSPPSLMEGPMGCRARQKFVIKRRFSKITELLVNER